MNKLNDDVRALTRSLVNLVTGPTTDLEENEARLAAMLDALAHALNGVPESFDERDYPDAPDTSYDDLRAAAVRQFPDFGFYNSPEHVLDHIADSRCLVEDAIDDLADITGDLIEFDWRWRNTSQMDALWWLTFSYQSHWRQHLRSLQAYLTARSRGCR